MLARRMILGIGTLAGCASFALTLWLSLNHDLDLFQAVVRAVGAGIVTLAFALFLSAIIVKLSGSRG